MSLPQPGLLNLPPSGGEVDTLALLNADPARLRRVSRQLFAQAAEQLAQSCLHLAYLRFPQSLTVPRVSLEERGDLVASYPSSPLCADFKKHWQKEYEQTVPLQQRLHMIYTNEDEVWLVFGPPERAQDVAYLYLC